MRRRVRRPPQPRGGRSVSQALGSAPAAAQAASSPSSRGPRRRAGRRRERKGVGFDRNRYQSGRQASLLGGARTPTPLPLRPAPGGSPALGSPPAWESVRTRPPFSPPS